MNTVILIAGIVGLAVAAYAFVTLCIHAVRTRRPLDVVAAVAVAVAVVWLLLLYGDRLMR